MSKNTTFIESDCLDLPAALLERVEMKDILKDWVATLEYDMEIYAGKSAAAGMSAAETLALQTVKDILIGQTLVDDALPVPKKLLSIPKTYQIMGICHVAGTAVPEGLTALAREKERAREQAYPEELKG